MSAIFGLFNRDGQPVPVVELKRMNAALAMHGPDGGGVWSEGHVGLGQRLMCFTPEDRLERQPLRGGEGNYTLVLDGRVDNRPELTEALGIPAAEARGLPDSAFILRAYEKWGAECCGRLIGDFAFALYDRRDERLVVAKSGMSKRPIYYREAGGRFAFSSAPKGLFGLAWVPRAIDHQSLADYLVWAPRDPGRSLFAGVSELLDGRLLVVGRTGLEVREHWKPDPRREIRFARDSDYIDAFKELFERVVGSHLRSITPVGVMMSGGLDSSSVAATAARLLSARGERLNAFTEVPRAGFDGNLTANRYGDETPFVEAMGRQYDNLDLNFIRTDGRFFLDGIGEYFDAVEGPFRAAWNRIWFEEILRQSRGKNIRVLLTGLPGNLTISRSGEGLFPDLIRRGRWLHAYREAKACAGHDGTRSTLNILACRAAPLLPAPFWRLAGRLFRSGEPKFDGGRAWQIFPVIQRQFALLHRVEERARRNGHDFHRTPGRVNRARRYRDIRRWGCAHLATLGFEGLYGVQYRDPAGDTRIVEFCVSLPEEQHFSDGMPRNLIRRAMAERLPKEVVTNRRSGLQGADWVERAAARRSQIVDELTRMESSELARTAIDLKRVRRMLDETPDRGSAGDPKSLKYKSMLGSALMTGSYIGWFEAPARDVHGG